MTAFISRSLAPDSDFRRLLNAQGWEVCGQSLVELSPLPLPPLPRVDWIFFSSKNAVRFFFEQVQMPIGPVRWAALGDATAAALADWVGLVDFCGNGDPIETAAAFAPLAADRRVLFPGARHSQQSVQRLLGNDIEGLHLEVYDNRPVAKPELRNDLVLVFTSPLNAQAYLSQHALQSGQQVVAIGATTAAAITALDLPVRVAEAATETALAEAVLAL